MRDLSLHLLDLLENAVAAGASAIWVRVAELADQGLLELVVEDDGPGLQVTAEQALDPFYTTKRNKRTGLGLALLRTSAELAGGSLTLDRSPHGGLRVRALLQLLHVDRLPLGDVGSTLAAMACTHPEVAFSCELRGSAGACEVKTRDLSTGAAPEPIELARLVSESLRVGREKVGW